MLIFFVNFKLLALLETNASGPDDVKIDIEEFDLNAESRAKFKETRKIERDEYEAKVVDDINRFRTETENIINEYWEPLFVKPKSIYVLARDSFKSKLRLYIYFVFRLFSHSSV